MTRHPSLVRLELCSLYADLRKASARTPEHALKVGGGGGVSQERIALDRAVMHVLDAINALSGFSAPAGGEEVED